MKILESYESHTRVIAEINAAVMDWFDTIDIENIPAGMTERKRLLTQHIVRHMNANGFPEMNENSPEIASYFSANTWLSISLSRNPPVMGGKKTRKTRREKKARPRTYKNTKRNTQKRTRRIRRTLKRK
jgi:hypothetical protein